MATFLPPLSYNHMYEHWSRLLQETSNLSRVILVHLSLGEDESGRQASSSLSTVNTLFQDSSDSQSPSKTAPDIGGLVLTGTVSLALPSSETGPFRGLIGNLFVSPAHRRQGIARRLLASIEDHAFKHGRWNLMLDTTVGTEAENVYPRLGWEKLGLVKDYGISPADGRLVDEVFFVKDLRGLAQKGQS